MSSLRKAAAVFLASIMAWTLSSTPCPTLLGAQPRPASTAADLYRQDVAPSSQTRSRAPAGTYQYSRTEGTASPTATCGAINNCSFETGAFPNWIPNDLATPFFPLQ